MTFDRSSVTVKEAQRLIAPYIKEGKIEKVPLLESEGRHLAVNVDAPHPIPHFRRSVMDGYAVRSQDIKDASPSSPITLFVKENIPAGSVPTYTITQGICSRIMTGAVIPKGADAVIKLEDTDNRRTQVAIQTKVVAGTNVTEIGSEVVLGQSLLKKGEKIDAGILALLATFGYASIEVYKRPKVAILSTGSELLKPGDDLQPGKIRDSNHYMLYSQIKNAGGHLLIMDQISDNANLVQEKVLKAFSQVDLVITTGGVSVGDHDVMTHIVSSWNGFTLFNKIQMRPGSPTTVSVRNKKVLFALSGNPGACFVGFELFVRPFIWGMQGKKDCYLTTFSAYLSEDFVNDGTFPRFVRGKFIIKNGIVYVKPVGVDQSNIVTSMKDATVLIKIPKGPIILHAKNLVEVIQLNVTE